MTKVCLVKAMFFPVVTYGCESWTVKKAEHQKIVIFELWCWRRLLRVVWTARRSKRSIIMEINPAHSLEGVMLKLKLQFFGHVMWRVNSLEKTLMLGKIEGRRRRERQRMRWLDGITDSVDMNLSNSGRWWRTGKPGMLRPMGLWRVGHDWVTEQQQQTRMVWFILSNVCSNSTCAMDYSYIFKQIWHKFLFFIVSLLSPMPFVYVLQHLPFLALYYCYLCNKYILLKTLKGKKKSITECLHAFAGLS